MRRFLLTIGIVAVTAGGSQAVTLSDKLHGTLQKGNRHYNNGEHEAALQKYLEAEMVDSAHSVPHFNAGGALYRLGRYPEGAREFLNSASSLTDSIAAMSYYNLGNSMFRAGDLESAAEAFRRSLLISPDDDDAKYNLELTMRMMENQQQPESGEQQEEDEEPPDEDQDQLAKEKGGQDEEEQPRSEDEMHRDESHEDQQRADEQSPPSEISPEDLERILAAIEASDKNTQEEMLKKAAKRKRITGKDW